MNKPIILISCFIFILFGNTVFAQDELKMAEDKDSKRDTKALIIESLDGKNQTLHLMPDYANHILKISCLKDTITDYDFWGEPVEPRVLNKKFIEIKYAVRGGSGVGVGDILILCVNGNKLCEAMHAERLLTGEGGEETENYYINIAALEGNSKKTYKLIVNVHDDANSKRNPEANYNYNNQSILHFDVNQNVFYSIKEYLFDSSVIAYNPKTSKLIGKQKIKGNFPVMILGKETYYFIKDEWYQLKSNNELNKYAPNTTK